MIIKNLICPYLALAFMQIQYVALKTEGSISKKLGVSNNEQMDKLSDFVNIKKVSGFAQTCLQKSVVPGK